MISLEENGMYDSAKLHTVISTQKKKKESSNSIWL